MNSKSICGFIWIICWDFVYLFNIDTHFPTIYSKPAETYFGYSVMFHSTSNNDDTWLLVGAPRANQSFSNTLQSPGTLFKCSYLSKSCHEVELDRSGNRETRNYQDFKRNQWLGVSLDQNSEGTVVTCAHRWKNQKYYQNWKKSPTPNIQDYYSNGLCYTINKDLRPNTAKRHIPLVSGVEQVVGWGIPYFAFGMAGMSSHFTEDNKLLLGAPGVFSWQGKLITISNIADSVTKAVLWSPDRLIEKHTNFMYLGYSVTSGRFFGLQPSISYVVGAPRYNYTGKVYIVRPDASAYSIEKSWEGKQLGEYFGAALCSIDLNADGYDDLIVGSPLYAITKEEGKVYIFINKKGTEFMQPLELTGSKTEGARFGMTIAALGDINLDGYPDFAVGAPYDDGNGVVYIYHGDAEAGIAFDLSQKLVAKTINPGLKGFGISIAKGRDIDRNSYPDIAIGSYDSGHAVILRSLPSVVFHAKVNSSPTKLSISSFPCKLNNQDVGCFNLTTCIRYESPRNLPYVDVETKLSFDTIIKKESERGFFYDNGQGKVVISENYRLQGRNEKCNTYQAFLKPNIRNFFTPIEILYEFEVSQQPKDAFCSSCAVLNPRSKTSVSHQIYFLNGCENKLCYSDLHLKANVVDQHRKLITNPLIWTGLNKTIMFDVSVFNSGESAYLSELNVTVPSWSNFVRQPTICSDLTTGNRENFLICDIGNPLPPNSTTSYQFYLNVEMTPLDLKELIVNFKVTTGSEEEEALLHDNNVVITIPTKLNADITVYGSTAAEYISYANMTNGEDSLIPFTHVYQVVNLGPSPLDSAKVHINVPEKSLDGSSQFIQNITVKTRDGTHTARVVECRGASSIHLTKEGKKRIELKEPGAVKRKKRDVTEQDRKTKNTKLFCDKAICRQIECDIVTMAPNDGVKIDIELQLDAKILEELKLSADLIDYTTEARAVILNSPSDIQPPFHKPDFAQVVTSFDTGRTSSQDLPIWVIPVSIILGILLLLAVAALFYKLGFFQRSDREALLQAQEEDDLIK